VKGNFNLNEIWKWVNIELKILNNVRANKNDFWGDNSLLNLFS